MSIKLQTLEEIIEETVRLIGESDLGEPGIIIDLDDCFCTSLELFRNMGCKCGYMEKKYVGVPMKLARKAVLDQLRQS